MYRYLYQNSRIEIRDNNIIIFAIWYNVPFRVYHTDEIRELFDAECIKNNIPLSTVSNYVWVFDCGPEGLSADEFVILHQYLNQLGVPDKNFRVVFSAVEDCNKLPYPAMIIPERMWVHGQWYNTLKSKQLNFQSIPMKYNLACLMRRASFDRINFAKELWKNFSDSEILLTLGVDGMRADLFPEDIISPRKLPVQIEDTLALDQYNYHVVNHTLFYQAPINIIVETSNQIDGNSWKKIFITEKTYKTMAWYQFPLWYAVPGLINEVRKLGFDVFDDLLDNHSYDNIEDPDKRKIAVIDLAKKFLEQDPCKLRLEHWHRFEANVKLYESKMYFFPGGIYKFIDDFARK